MSSSSGAQQQQQTQQNPKPSQPEHGSPNPDPPLAHHQPPPPQQPQPQQQQQPQQHQSLQAPSQFRAISRNNSNTSTASSGNRGDLSSTISTATSIASSRSQLSRNQLFDHRQLLSSCGGSSTPIRSFQRATISSVVKTRAFDNNPVLQGLLTATSSGQNSTSNSQTPSPLSTPVFSRSRSLRMSGGPRRYQQSPLHQRANSRTPDLYSFSQGDPSNESQVRILELSNERSELKESLEFLECERRVLMDSTKELRESLQKERSHWKKELEDARKQLTDAIAARIKAESQVTRLEMELNDLRSIKRNQEHGSRNSLIDPKEYEELKATNEELKRLLTEKIRYNGLNSAQECTSVVTEMAKLRLELNEKDKLIEQYSTTTSNKVPKSNPVYEIDTLNKFLDQTVECIKGWPEDLAGSSHVQDLMKTLLSAYRPDQDCFEHL